MKDTNLVLLGFAAVIGGMLIYRLFMKIKERSESKDPKESMDSKSSIPPTGDRRSGSSNDSAES